MSAVAGARQKEALHKSFTSQYHSLQNSFSDSVWNQIVYSNLLFLYLAHTGTWAMQFWGERTEQQNLLGSSLAPNQAVQSVVLPLTNTKF